MKDDIEARCALIQGKSQTLAIMLRTHAARNDVNSKIEEIENELTALHRAVNQTEETQ